MHYNSKMLWKKVWANAVVGSENRTSRWLDSFNMDLYWRGANEKLMATEVMLVLGEVLDEA